MSLFVTGTLVPAVVIAAALLARALLRRQSAARRHAILAAGLFVGAAAPAFAPLVPTWDIQVPWSAAPLPAVVASGGVRVEPPAAATAVSAAPAAPAPPAGPGARPRSAWAIAAIVWIVTAVVMLAGLVTAFVRLARLTARCTPVVSGPWRESADALVRRARLSRHVRLLQSGDPSLLLTWGLFRPCIVLPAGAGGWPAARRDVVLAHELAHIRRHDWALQIAAETVRAVHWFNPLVWVACVRLRRDSEHACDDAVLNAGATPTEYAAHLLAVARHAAGRGRAWAAAPAVAEPSTLERRITAMLSQTCNRKPLTVRTAVLAVAGALAMTIPLAAVSFIPHGEGVRPPAGHRGDVFLTAAAVAAPAQEATPAAAAQSPSAPSRPAPAPDASPVPTAAPDATPVPSPPPGPGEISGVVRDPSGGVLPGARLTLADSDRATARDTVTDGAGRFRFSDVPPGRYSLVASLPAFARASREITVASGDRVEPNFQLRLGVLTETLDVLCPGTASDLALQPVVFVPRTYTPPRSAGLDDPTPAGLPPVRSSAQQGATGAPPEPVRVGGDVSPPRKITDRRPSCPSVDPPDSGVLIILEGTVSEDGFLTNLHQLRPAVGSAPEFEAAALAAVRQWTYTPARLNGKPVAVISTITVAFSRADGRDRPPR